ncbi:MAG TPA: hypothetical protein PKA66_07230 [Gemmatimonadales bacterium]|nr:hypothetical protein [Gemmatimonadales bacterium]
MTTGTSPIVSMQRIVAGVALLFGLMTVVSGGRVALGLSDPGYMVFRPLLLYNTTMGVAYLVAGMLLWRWLRRGRAAAGVIFLLNLLVLAGILAVYQRGGAVATESLKAMTLRTVVWLALFAGATWLVRAGNRRPPAARSG